MSKRITVRDDLDMDNRERYAQGNRAERQVIWIAMALTSCEPEWREELERRYFGHLRERYPSPARWGR